MADHHSRAVYVISVAAELAGVHPQTLRIYERKGLLDPARTAGGNRRYSDSTSSACAASPSSPTRASTSPASSGCWSSRPRSPACEDDLRRLRRDADRAGGRRRAPSPARAGAAVAGGVAVGPATVDLRRVGALLAGRSDAPCCRKLDTTALTIWQDEVDWTDYGARSRRSGPPRPSRPSPPPSSTARANANPEVTPDHLLAALLRQDDSIVLARPAEAGPGPAHGAQPGRRGRRPPAQGVRQRPSPT